MLRRTCFQVVFWYVMHFNGAKDKEYGEDKHVLGRGVDNLDEHCRLVDQCVTPKGANVKGGTRKLFIRSKTNR
ncbi:MAG: hypothetical protein LBI05_01955 [Planctomycetaceae bacterium]|jgi:hypothetical protein|nr:hypothetical protein [Planctomycetaceae bacterium]